MSERSDDSDYIRDGLHLAGWYARADLNPEHVDGIMRDVKDLLHEHSVGDDVARNAEIGQLRRWKAEATTLFDGLQDLGRALGLPLGVLITGPLAIEAAERLRTERDAAVELTHDERLALAEQIRIAFDTPPDQRVIQDTWLYAAAMAEQWYVDRANRRSTWGLTTSPE